MFWNHTGIDSINQYYHCNIVRAPLPLQPVEEEGNYAGPVLERLSWKQSCWEEDRQHTQMEIKGEEREACFFVFSFDAFCFGDPSDTLHYQIVGMALSVPGIIRIFFKNVQK